MELRGGNKFIIIRQLADPSDTDTYYVRAVISKSSDGSAIKTVDLADGGDQRFSYNWTVPYQADEFQIDIKTTVYTDSGYTVKSNRYTIESRDYIIRHKVLGGGGGGGSSIDYKKIKEIMLDIEIPKYDKALATMSDILLRALEINRRATIDKEVPLTDLSGLEKEIKAVKKHIDNVKVPAPDMKPFIDEFKTVKNSLVDEKNAFKGLKQALSKLLDNAKSFYIDDVNDIKKSIKSLSDNFKKELSKILVITTKPMAEIEKVDVKDKANKYIKK